MQRNDLKEAQESMIRSIQSILNQPPFSTKGSAGIVEIKKHVDAYLTNSSDYFDDPKNLFDKIKAIANSKEGGVKEVGRLFAKKGDVKGALGQLARVGKTALNKVDPTVQAFHKALIALDINDENNAFTKGKIKLAETTFMLKRQSEGQIYSANKRHSAVLFNKPVNPSSADELQNHAAMFILNEVKQPDYNHGELDREQSFLYQTRILIERLGEDALTNADLSSRRSYVDGIRQQLTDFIDDYRAIYHPQFKAKGETPPTPPAELENAFSSVMDILTTKRKSDINFEDLYKVQTVCEKIYSDYWNVEQRSSHRLE